MRAQCAKFTIAARLAERIDAMAAFLTGICGRVDFPGFARETKRFPFILSFSIKFLFRESR